MVCGIATSFGFRTRKCPPGASGEYTILFALCFDAFKQRVRNAVAWLHADPETQEKMTNAGALDTPKTQQATA